jgi:hypothetical protein
MKDYLNLLHRQRSIYLKHRDTVCENYSLQQSLLSPADKTALAKLFANYTRDLKEIDGNLAGINEEIDRITNIIKNSSN